MPPPPSSDRDGGVAGSFMGGDPGSSRAENVSYLLIHIKLVENPGRVPSRRAPGAPCLEVQIIYQFIQIQ